MDKKLRSALNNAYNCMIPKDMYSRIEQNIACTHERTMILPMKKNYNKKVIRYVLSAAAALVLVITGAFGGIYYSNNVAIDSVIGIDVNPSVQITANKHDRVLDAIAINKEAEVVLADMNLKNTDLNIAVNAIIGSMFKNGYLEDNVTDKILITVQNDNTEKAQNVKTSILANIKEQLKEKHVSATVYNQTASKDNTDAQKVASEYGISVGKSIFINNLCNKYPELSASELADKSIAEIADFVAENKLDISDIIDYDYDDSIHENIADEIEDINEDIEEGKKPSKQNNESSVSSKTESVVSDSKPIESENENTQSKVESKESKPQASESKVESKESKVESKESKPQASESKVESKDSKPQATESNKETSSKTEEIPNIELMKKTKYHGYDVVFFIGDSYDFKNNHSLEEFDLSKNSDFETVYWSEFYDIKTNEPIKIFTSQDDTFLNNGNGLQDILNELGKASKPANIKLLSTDEAKQVALKNAGLSSKEVKYVKAELDKEDGIPVYEIDFKANGYEYEYEINAYTGKVIKKDIEKDDDKVISNPEKEGVSEEEAQKAAVKHAGFNYNNVTFISAKLTKDDGVKLYEIEFKADGYEYDYDIAYKDGTVLKHSKEADKQLVTNSGTELTKNEVKEIVFNHANVSAADVRNLEIERDKDDGKVYYEVEFTVGAYEYSCTVDAFSGKITEFEKEIDD